jgi:hypothetical protein
MHEGGVVESRMNEDFCDVDFFVTKRLGCRAHVVLAQSHFQNVSDVGLERQAEIRNGNKNS